MHSPHHQAPRPPLGSLRSLVYRHVYDTDEHSIAVVRDDFSHRAKQGGLDEEITEAALLCLSELSTNVVRHACDVRERPRFHVTSAIVGARCRWLRIGVHDRDRDHIPELPDRFRAPEMLMNLPEDSERGRGLLLVAHMATAAGVDHGPFFNGKVIWCSWPLDGQEATQGDYCRPRVASWAASATPSL
jgi:anti-sigma regulatory factor (Ser/Thr protein kinase)